MQSYRFYKGVDELMTRTDTIVRSEGMEALIVKLGLVDAERFVALLLREPFNYTEWRRMSLLAEDINVHELSKRAMEYLDKE